MRRVLALALCSLAACAAPSSSPTPDGGSPVVHRHEYVPISGTVQFHPLEQAWRAGTLGIPPVPPEAPGLAGVTLNVENSVDALIGRPPLASTTLAADGKFSFPRVDVVNVSVALVADVTATPDIMESGFGLWRYEPGQPRPPSFSNMPVWIISTAFEQKLATAAGIQTSDLEAEGFVLGQIVDKEGHGIAGAQLAQQVVGANGFTPQAVVDSDQNHLYYLNADLSGLVTDNQTSASGAFLYFPGASTSDYTALKAGMTFETHLSGARAKTALALFIAQT